jgi:hypothetical protein
MVSSVYLTAYRDAERLIAAGHKPVPSARARKSFEYGLKKAAER